MTKSAPARETAALKNAAVLALQRLPGSVRSAVLADGSIAKKYDLTISRPIHLPNGSIDRDVLLSAFTAAADWDSPTVELKGDVPITARVWVQRDDSCIVSTGKNRIRFPHAALLSRDSNR